MEKEGVFSGKLLSFVTKDGLILDGFLVGPKKSNTCVVYIHGMTGNFYGHGVLHLALANKLKKLGISLFAINTRGHDAVSIIRRKNKRGKDHLTAGTELEKFEIHFWI